MSTKQVRRKYTKEFKEEAVALVIEQGYSVPKVAEAVGVTANSVMTGNTQQAKRVSA